MDDALEEIADNNSYLTSKARSRKLTKAGKAFLARAQSRAQTPLARLKRVQSMYLSKKHKRDGV